MSHTSITFITLVIKPNNIILLILLSSLLIDLIILLSYFLFDLFNLILLNQPLIYHLLFPLSNHIVFLRSNRLVHQRLRKPRLINFIMSIQSITVQINYNILSMLLYEFKTEIKNTKTSFNIVPI